MLAQHLERVLFVDRMALHQDPLGALGKGAALERSFEVTVLGEPPEDDLDRALPVLWVAVGDVGEDAAFCRLDHEFRIRFVQKRNNRAGSFVDDLLDQLERMLRALSEADERYIRLFAGGHRSNLADLDLRCNHLVPEAADDFGDNDQSVLALVRHEHAETLYVCAVSGRSQLQLKEYLARRSPPIPRKLGKTRAEYHRRPMDQSKIRNFSIIAHIDHGKSTLADRILEITEAVSAREMREQLLDSMDLERERGITIKAQAVRVSWKGHELNLIDTPGHVDFTYEVSRSLQACEGALLVVDAAQGIEAQTLANAYLAIENGLEIVPVVNKIDLPQADPDGASIEVADLLGDDPARVVRISAKTGVNVAQVLDAIIERVPAPAGEPDAPPRALVFDSSYDQYRGVVAFIRVIDGVFKRREALQTMATGTRFDAEELGFFSPTMRPVESLTAGEVGYVVTGLKELSILRVGDTLTTVARPATEALPGYKDVKPMVFAGLFPTDSDAYPELRDALEKLKLNDGALFYEPETSTALGFGFRCGFLGLLHMEIVRERLEREFDLDLLVTAPTVAYRAKERNADWLEVHNPAEFPREVEEVEEPYVKASIIVPKEFVGAVMELCNDRRGTFDHMEYLSPVRVHLTYDLPLGEIVLDFYDQLKSRTRGYASFDYDLAGFKPGNLVRVDVLVGNEMVDALSLIIHRDFAYERGKLLVEKLREEIPRQMFDVPIQAAIGSRVIARETVKARRKDVLAKCYGGDISRKRKLLENQKKGKKRMKQVGAVEVPQEAFLAVLNIGQGSGKS
jgi:GTP-binding protein LepA